MIVLDARIRDFMGNLKLSVRLQSYFWIQINEFVGRKKKVFQQLIPYTNTFKHGDLWNLASVVCMQIDLWQE